MTFLGAARTVTGSMYLVEAGARRVLVDGGAFQGSAELEARNRDLPPVDLKSVSHLFLTHAHQDHCGRIPFLVKNGFAGAILCTAPTAELGELMLEDTAKIQEEDAARAERRRVRANEQPSAESKKGLLRPAPGEWHGAGLAMTEREPLFSMADVAKTATMFAKPVVYGETVELGDLSVKYRDAGHILGAAFLEMKAVENGATQRLIFSGDQGNLNKPVIPDPELPSPEAADYLFIESTYGDRKHKPMKETIEEFKGILRATLPNGNVIIPAFALERAQEMLYVMREMYETRELPACAVYLDSPLAIDATEVYMRHPEFFDEEARKVVSRAGNPFRFPGVNFLHDAEASKKLNGVRRGAVIIAGSGMCNGGRILHHLRHHLPHPENAVLIIGYQSEGTLGRRLVDGEKLVYIRGQSVAVNAAIHTVNGFSAHADRSELLRWSSALNPRPHTFLVHGEDGPMKSLAAGLNANGFSTEMPEYQQTVEL